MKAIVFDLDGTLINTKSYIVKSIIETLKYFNIKLTVKNSEVDSFLYFSSMDDFFKRIMDESEYSKIGELKHYYITHYDKKAAGKASLYPGIFDLLLELKNKYKLFIATSKFTNCAIKELEENKVAKFFCEIQGTDFGIPYKPNTFILEKFSNTYNLKADEIIMIGDTGNDILFGKNFGTKTIAVTYGIWKKENFIRENIVPDYFASDAFGLKEKINLFNNFSNI